MMVETGSAKQRAFKPIMVLRVALVVIVFAAVGILIAKLLSSPDWQAVSAYPCCKR